MSVRTVVTVDKTKLRNFTFMWLWDTPRSLSRLVGEKPEAVSVLRQTRDNGRTFVRASIQNIITVHLFDH